VVETRGCTDIEADGAIPRANSMLSIGSAAFNVNERSGSNGREVAILELL
jgi:hypothetical protein